jgi:hypothetical protein
MLMQEEVSPSTKVEEKMLTSASCSNSSRRSMDECTHVDFSQLIQEAADNVTFPNKYMPCFLCSFYLIIHYKCTCTYIQSILIQLFTLENR